MTKEMQQKFYKVLTVLLYGSETWIMRKSDESRIELAEITFVWSMKGCIRQERRLNVDIRQ
jgi:hypothetical protein